MQAAVMQASNEDDELICSMNVLVELLKCLRQCTVISAEISLCGWSVGLEFPARQLAVSDYWQEQF